MTSPEERAKRLKRFKHTVKKDLRTPKYRKRVEPNGISKAKHKRPTKKELLDERDD